MHPNFLNLETKKNKVVSLESVLVDGIEHSSTEEVLTAIMEFTQNFMPIMTHCLKMKLMTF